MSKETATLAQLAKKRAGIGPVRTAQPGTNPLVAVNAAPTADGDGVDVSSAVLANVIINPLGADATWTLYGRSVGQTDTFEQVDGFVDVVTPAGVSRKYRAVCESEAELYVQVTAIGTSCAIAIEPCNGVA